MLTGPVLIYLYIHANSHGAGMPQPGGCLAGGSLGQGGQGSRHQSSTKLEGGGVCGGCALGESVVLSSPLMLGGREDRAQCKAGVQHEVGYAWACTVGGETERRDLGKRILRLHKYSFSGPSF